jgi:hypothetical protein
MSSYITQDIFDFAKNAKQNKSNIIKLLEDQEVWVIEDPNIQEKIDYLLSNWKEINESKEIQKDRVIKLLSYVATGDMINFLSSLEKIDKEFIDSLINSVNSLNENEMPIFSMLLAKRLLVIYRLAILPRIFSEDRLKALEQEINNL